MAFNVNSSQYTFLNKFSRVSPNSTEWARIEYHLQLSLGLTSAVVKNIWSVASGHNTSNFEKNNKGLLVLDCWLESSVLDENNRLDKVCQKGFDFPQSGLLFPTGQIRLSDNATYGKNKIYEFLLLKIAVGKSYCLPAQNSKKEKYKLPYGFDSLYLYNEDGEENEEFRHDYVLFDNSQVLPSYLVHFEFDAKKEESISPPLCDICGETKATVYCKNDMCSLCFDCDEEQHNKGGTLMRKHQRVPLGEKPKSFGNCAQHPDNKQELFCNICHIPLCVYCKINGSHSTGEPQNHQLAKITDAYNKAIAESRDLDPLLEKRKNTLSDLLLKIDVRIKDINRNASAIEEKIYQILQEALLKLQEETQKKMTFLIGDQLELKRQYEQVQWIESFLKYQQEILSPSDYLNNWSRHILLRNDILNLSNIPVVSNVMADLKLEGKINVISEELSRRQEYEDNYPGAEKNTLDGDISLSSSKFRSTIFNRHNIGDKNGSSRISKQSINTKGGSSFTSRDDFSGSQGLGFNLTQSQSTNLPDLTNRSLSTSSPSKPIGVIKNTQYAEISQAESPQKPAIKTSVVGGGSSMKLFQSATKNKANIAQNSVPEDENDMEDEYPLIKDSKKTTFSETKYPERMSGDNFLPSYSLQEDAKNAKASTRMRPEEQDKVFSKSTILVTEKDRDLIYFNLPQISGSNNSGLPDTENVAQFKRGDTLDQVLKNVKRSGSGKMPPAVILIQSTHGNIFGGYASECWDFQSKNSRSFGDTTSFLFNVKSNQKFIPIPIENTPRSPSNQWLFQKSDSFGFGVKEMIVGLENETVSSEMGTVYTGGGSSQKEDSTFALIGGMKESSIDKLEIYFIR